VQRYNWYKKEQIFVKIVTDENKWRKYDLYKMFSEFCI